MLAFSNDYYGMIFRATQSVELFCAYVNKADKGTEIQLLLGIENLEEENKDK